jgi:hypothetical protein
MNLLERFSVCRAIKEIKYLALCIGVLYDREYQLGHRFEMKDHFFA